MTAPNLGNLILHAAGKVDGAGALTDGVNMTSVARTGAGAYTATMATELDATQRVVMLVGADTDGVLEHVIASDTDAVFLVGADTNGTPATPADHAFNFAVFRTVKLG